MGTRADFYVGRGSDAEWLGSISSDGYPDAVDLAVFEVSTVEAYRDAVSRFLTERDDATFSHEPWPWPWNNSRTTDYSYAYDEGVVWGTSFGYGWWKVDPTDESFGHPDEDSEDDAQVDFPDMSERKGSPDWQIGRSGMLIAEVSKTGPALTRPNSFGQPDPGGP